MTRRVRWTLLATAGAVLWLAIYRLRPAPLEVQVAVAARGPLRQTIHAEGQTRVRDRFLVTAPVAGRLERPRVRPGDAVLSGALLGWLVPAPLDERSRRQAEAQVAALEDASLGAEAQFRAAEAALVVAVAERRRADSLAAGGHLAPSAVEGVRLAETTRRREFEAARARDETARHEVQRARAALASAGSTAAPAGVRTELRAPVGGRVLRVLEENARVVPAGPAVMELGDLTHLEVVGDLLSADAVRVRAGDTVLVEGWGGDSVLRARVRLVEPSGFTKVSALGIEEQRVNLLADLAPAPPGLGDRYRVELQVVQWGAADVLTVPESALLLSGDTTSVLLLAGGRLQERAVTIGHRGDYAVEVLSGLAPGDTVVRYPTADATPGRRARPAP